MPTADSVLPKNPIKQRAGRVGAEVRWANHQRRIVRLDDLTREQRAVVLALVDAARSAKAAAS